MYLKLDNINKALHTDGAAFAKESDSQFENSIKTIAHSIIDRGDCPVIAISGPSGSGKTTSALMLEKYLDGMGHETTTLSLDNYFYPMTAKEKLLFAQNKIDLESPARIDSDFLNSQLEDIIACKEVRLPKFNFKENTREDSGITFRRNPGEIVVLEGIHALNPDVIQISHDRLSGVYVSVRTRVKTADGDMIHPEYIRLLRRMLRDRIYRARSFADTAGMYKNVQRGENLYIMPYKHRADFDIDTFVPYEINVYRDMIYEGFKTEGLCDKLPKLYKLLDGASPVDVSIIPKTSLIREFIGNGIFEY